MLGMSWRLSETTCNGVPFYKIYRRQNDFNLHKQLTPRKTDRSLRYMFSYDIFMVVIIIFIGTIVTYKRDYTRSCWELVQMQPLLRLDPL